MAEGGGGCQMLMDAHVGEEGKFELLTWAFQKLMKLKHTYLTILICWTQKNYTQHTLEISLQTNQFLSQWNNWNCSIEFFATTKSWYASYSWREGLQNKVHVREGGGQNWKMLMWALRRGCCNAHWCSHGGGRGQKLLKSCSRSLWTVPNAVSFAKSH